MIRLNKYLSMCGVTSRRGAEALIAEGKVRINGVVVEKLGTIVDETKDEVKVNGDVVTLVTETVYVALNKPKMVMTTLHDPFRRKTVVRLLKSLPARVYPVGRLDYDTEGILLLTNDGELAYRLAHPRFGIKKIYEVKVRGEFGVEQARKIKQGIKLEDGSIGKGEVAILSAYDQGTKIRITLTEGRKREVKQLCKAVGNPVLHLKRIDFAGITQRDLPLGKWRYLTAEEVHWLRKKVAMEQPDNGGGETVT